MSDAGFRQGLEYLEAGQLKDAEEAFQSYLQEHPEDALGHNKLGVVYGRLQDMEKAKACFLKAIELDKNCIHAWNNLGNIARQDGELDQAIRYYQKAVDIDPINPIPAKNLRTVQRQAKWSFSRIKDLLGKNSD
ncbi:TPR repeat-containing protein [Desulfitobacterium chlororespirans DSM 11544]|uniref:TPR repeat-containing protein n=2 Tax=Desulfitobacterium chlororespirans TaxID=51616 RepID=A0A1M7TFV2_9FIRM|nr:TPR repeat-containing protein [Desulfitobacterium chlororespirans DSM 11544]